MPKKNQPVKRTLHPLEKEDVTKEDKLKVLQTVISGLEKTFGKGVIMNLEGGAIVPISTISTGSTTKVKIVKNKVAPPFKVAIVTIRYGEGISRTDELITLGEEYGLIDKSGSWYAYNDERIGQGQDNARLFLKDNKDIANKLEKEIRAKIKAEQNPPKKVEDKSAKKV